MKFETLSIYEQKNTFIKTYIFYVYSYYLSTAMTDSDPKLLARTNSHRFELQEEKNHAS
jgi:hypothetical protein